MSNHTTRRPAKGEVATAEDPAALHRRYASLAGFFGAMAAAAARRGYPRTTAVLREQSIQMARMAARYGRLGPVLALTEP